jgi:hypothetical protein
MNAKKGNENEINEGMEWFMYENKLSIATYLLLLNN